MRIKKFNDLSLMDKFVFAQAMVLFKDRYIVYADVEDEFGQVFSYRFILRGYDSDNLEDCLWHFAVEEALKTNTEAEVNMKFDLINKNIIITIETYVGVKTYTITEIERG